MVAGRMSARDIPTREEFEANVKEHELTILHDDGIYRHIMMRRLDHNHQWYELISSPNLLTYNGDMGTFVFARNNQDMFQFFNADDGREINAHYWEEKISAYQPVGQRAFPRYRYVWSCYAIQYAIREYRRLT